MASSGTESSHENPSTHDDKQNAQQLETIRTISRVENPNYYEKNGLRTEGDGMDHEHHNYQSTPFIMTVIGCAFALTASQIYPLLYLTIGTRISADLNRPDLFLWVAVAGILAMGSFAPFIGPLADLLGRKPLLIIGFMSSLIGSAMCGAALNAPTFIAGQVFLGFGAVTEELLAIAIVAEIVPTARRPMFSAIILSAIIPWSPGTFYAARITISSWRYIGLVLGLWNLLTLIIIGIWYKPPPRVNSLGLSTKEKLRRIDFFGGGLVILALLLFLVGLGAGGTTYPWKDRRVLGPLIAGPVVMIIFVLWEFYGARYPLFPKRIVHAPRPFFCMMIVIFAAGINYIPLVAFWPIEAISVYQADLSTLGLYGLPIGMGILGGAIISSLLLAVSPKHAHHIMLAFCIVQTVASACMVLADPNNVGTIFGPLILALIGVGGVLVPNQVLITVITPDDLLASITALTVGLRAQCQVIGLAIFYNRLQNQVTKYVYKEAVLSFVGAGFYDPKIITSIVTGLTSHPFSYYREIYPTQLGPNSGPATQKLEAAMIKVFTSAFQEIWYITIAFGAVAVIAAGFMGSVNKYMDKHVAVVVS